MDIFIHFPTPFLEKLAFISREDFAHQSLPFLGQGFYVFP